VTAIFLIAEITQSYQLFIPLMLVCAVAYLLKYYSENLSARIVQPGLIRKSYRLDRILLNQVNIKSLIEKEFPAVGDMDTLRKILEVFSGSNRDIISVQGENGKLVGIITLSNIQNHLADVKNFDNVFATDLMQVPTVTMQVDEPASAIMAKFEKYNLRYLPVFKRGKFKGFISRTALLTRYREELTRANRFI
ncbi:MAG TPA: CBS domain-containing protein, partial [Adhaeribacter sp.]|nr:CBS domain-containing protein [Adhaeribacter sp.]